MLFGDRYANTIVTRTDTVDMGERLKSKVELLVDAFESEENRVGKDSSCPNSRSSAGGAMSELPSSAFAVSMGKKGSCHMNGVAMYDLSGIAG